MTSRAFVVTALLAAAVIVVSGAAGDPGNGERKQLDKIQHIVVIYEENHSFDNLYGGWEGVNGRSDADAANTIQVGQGGAPYACLLLNDVNLTSPPLSPDCTDTTTGSTFLSHFTNTPFSIEGFIPKTAKTCPPPGASSSVGFKDGTGDPGGCTRDLVNRFYQSQYQLNHGLQNHYTTGSDAVGLTQGLLRNHRPAHLRIPAQQGPPGLCDRRQLLPGGVRRLVPQPSLADRGCDTDLARRGALGRGFERHADQLPAVPRHRAGQRSSRPTCLPRAGRDRPESRPCVRRVRRQHGPASVPALPGEPAATAAERNDHRRRAERGRRQLGVVLRRLVERERGLPRRGVDERAGCGRVRRSELDPEPGVAVLPEQGVPVSPSAIQLLRVVRAGYSGTHAPA